MEYFLLQQAESILYFLVYLLLSFLIGGPKLQAAGVLKSLIVMAAGGMVGGMIS